jgi:hypothetical protein
VPLATLFVSPPRRYRLKSCSQTLNNVEGPERYVHMWTRSFNTDILMFKYDFFQAFTQVSLLTGIVATVQEEGYKGYRSILSKSDSDVEFSSDCLPIQTEDSSSIQGLASILQANETSNPCAYPTANQAELDGEKVDEALDPRSPLTECPPTPALSNTQYPSESEGEDQDDLQAAIQSSLVHDSGKANAIACAPQCHSKPEASSTRPRERDPVRLSRGMLSWLMY